MSDKKSGNRTRGGRAATVSNTPSEPKSFASGDEAHEYGVGLSSDWEASLTPDEAAATARYKLISSTLNRRLRDGEDLDERQQQVVEHLDQSLNRARLPRSIIVMRGVEAEMVERYFRGNSVLLDKGYMSTTGDRNVARDFSVGGYIVNVRAPAGSRGMYIDNSQHGRRRNDDEREFIFARGSRLRINRINDNDRTIDAVLEQ